MSTQEFPSGAHPGGELPPAGASPWPTEPRPASPGQATPLGVADVSAMGGGVPPTPPQPQPQPQPQPPAGGGRKWRGRVLVGAVVVVLALVAVTAVLAIGFASGSQEQPPPVTGPADAYAEAPKCDGFSPEVRQTLPRGDSSLNQPMAGSAGGTGYRCLWVGDDEMLVTTEILAPADGRSGAARAAEWVKDLPGTPLTDPKIGDAAKLDAAQCDLTFHRSNLVVDIIGGRPGGCQDRLVALARDFASVNRPGK